MGTIRMYEPAVFAMLSVLRDLVRDAVGIALRLRQCDAVAQASDQPPLHVVAVRGVVWDARGVPEVRLLLHVGVGGKQQLEIRLEHSDDPRALGIIPTLEHSRVTAVVPLPVLIAQNRDLRNGGRGWRRPRGGRWAGSRQAVVVIEIATERHMRAEDAEEIGRDDSDAHLLRCPVEGRHDAALRADGGDVLERRGGAFSQVDEIHIGEREIPHGPLPHVVTGDGQTTRVFVRQRPEQDRIGDAEDRGGSADCQPERSCDGDRESRTLAQRPGGVTEIFRQHWSSGLDLLNHRK